MSELVEEYANEKVKVTICDLVHKGWISAEMGAEELRMEKHAVYCFFKK